MQPIPDPARLAEADVSGVKTDYEDLSRRSTAPVPARGPVERPAARW